MKYVQLKLTEGLIKVPQSLYNACAEYVASVCCTHLSEMLRNSTESSEQDNIKSAISFFQKKYNAKVLSTGSMNAILDKYLKININKDQVFSELPKNLQTDAVKRNLDELNLTMRITQYTGSLYSGSYTEKSNSIDVMDKYREDNSTTVNIQNMQKMMNTLFHELQHFVQFQVIQHVEKSGAQTKSSGKTAFADAEGYFTSGTEYSPHIGNMVNAGLDKLRDMSAKGELKNKTQDVRALSTDLIKDSEMMNALKSKGMQKEYNQAAKTVYSKLLQGYDEAAESTASTDYDATEQDMEAEQNELLKAKSEFDMKGIKVMINAGTLMASNDHPEYVFGAKATDSGFHFKIQYQGHKVYEFKDISTEELWKIFDALLNEEGISSVLDSINSEKNQAPVNVLDKLLPKVADTYSTDTSSVSTTSTGLKMDQSDVNITLTYKDPEIDAEILGKTIHLQDRHALYDLVYSLQSLQELGPEYIEQFFNTVYDPEKDISTELQSYRKQIRRERRGR